jgi:uncharacterized surface protein with fasciclin (FAS1) repeats
MSTSKFSKSIALTFGMAIFSTGVFASISSHAQSSTPGTTTTPAKTTTPATGPTVPDPKPSSGTTTPSTTTTPGAGTMTPDPTTTPNGGMSKPTKTPTTTTAPAGKTIVDVVGKNKYFTTLVSALKAADLVETLSGEGPYTVFAPTNAAFAKLPKGTLKKLLKPENKEQLKKILTYHVVAGAKTSKTLKSGTIETVEGSKIAIKIRGKQVTVNGAKVIMADVKSSNGVIHVIDAVIMPPTK